MGISGLLLAVALSVSPDGPGCIAIPGVAPPDSVSHPFEVHSPDSAVQVGEKLRLPLFGSRGGVVEYRWTLLSRPAAASRSTPRPVAQP